MEYRGWTVTATIDSDDERVYLTATADGKATLHAVALRGLCGKHATSHWHIGTRGPVYHEPELRLRTMSWVDREFGNLHTTTHD